MYIISKKNVNVKDQFMPKSMIVIPFIVKFNGCGFCEFLFQIITESCKIYNIFYIIGMYY